MQDSGVYLNDLGCFFVHIFSLESEFAFIAGRVLRNSAYVQASRVLKCSYHWHYEVMHVHNIRKKVTGIKEYVVILGYKMM